MSKKAVCELLSECNMENFSSLIGEAKGMFSRTLTCLGQKMHILPTSFKSIKKQLGVVETLPSAPGTRKYLTKEHGMVTIGSFDMGNVTNYNKRSYVSRGGIFIEGKNLPTSIVGIPNGSYENVHSLSREKGVELFRSGLDGSLQGDKLSQVVIKDKRNTNFISRTEEYISPMLTQHYASKGVAI